MAYDLKLADRIREYLVQFRELKVEEKKIIANASGFGMCKN